jgi:hypothetical protein
MHLIKTSVAGTVTVTTMCAGASFAEVETSGIPIIRTAEGVLVGGTRRERKHILRGACSQREVPNFAGQPIGDEDYPFRIPRSSDNPHH